MKIKFFPVFALSAILAAGAAARAAEVDEARAAVQKLAEAPNYAWTSVVVGRGGPQPVEFKTEKDGSSTFTASGIEGDPTVILYRAGKYVVNIDGKWKTGGEVQKTLDEGGGGFGPEGMVVARVSGFATAAAQASDCLGKAINIRKTADGFSGELTEAAVTEMLTFRRPPGAPAASMPQVTLKDAKGTIQLTVKDGMLAKLEIHVTALRTFNEQESAVDQTTTLTIKDVGTTRLDVTDEARKKLAEGAAGPASKP